LTSVQSNQSAAVDISVHNHLADLFVNVHNANVFAADAGRGSPLPGLLEYTSNESQI
jgi:hypothetical protein